MLCGLMQYVLKMLCMLCALYMRDLYIYIFDMKACYVICCILATTWLVVICKSMLYDFVQCCYFDCESIMVVVDGLLVDKATSLPLMLWLVIFDIVIAIDHYLLMVKT